jgi:hypothetical protein
VELNIFSYFCGIELGVLPLAFLSFLINVPFLFGRKTMVLENTNIMYACVQEVKRMCSERCRWPRRDHRKVLIDIHMILGITEKVAKCATAD